ncbi:MAG: amidase [Acidimicrobiales bacterium]
MTQLWQLSATQAAAMIRAKSVKPSEVVAAAIGRAQATNPALNAITIELYEEAMEAAAAADETVASGDAVGPLHGVPVTIKENVDVAGQPTTNGVSALAGVIATEDSPVVASLKRAGAIIIGRTNTPEFSMRATTDNPLRGPTHNPWDRDASPGGSSGGAGSACAAGMGPLHHGNDIAGSLRIPSFANGVATIKPTSTRVPRYNATAVAEGGALAQAMSVQGIITRHVSDIELATRVLIEPDPRDPLHVALPWDGPDLGAKPTVAFTTESAGYPIHPGIVELVERTVAMLADAGYEVVHADPPPVIDAARGWFSVASTEMKTTLDPVLRQVGSQDIIDIFDNYFALSELLDLDAYVKGLGDRTRILRQWNLFLDRYPLLITPFLMRPLYDLDYDTRGLDAVEDLLGAAIYSAGINFLGLPAGVMGLDLVEGRPAAVQIVGRRFREDLICQAMQAVEDRNGILCHRLWERESQSLGS